MGEISNRAKEALDLFLKRTPKFTTPEDLEKKEKELKELKETIERMQRTSDEEFPFGVLWQDEEEGGFMKFAGIIGMVLSLITLLVVLFK